MRRCVWSRNIKNRCSIYIYIYIYIYDISSIRVNDLTLILLTWRKWWAPNNASKYQMGFNSAFKGLNSYLKSKQVEMIFLNVGHVFSFWHESAMRRRWRKNNAGRLRGRRGDNAAACQVTVCWNADFTCHLFYTYTCIVDLTCRPTHFWRAQSSTGSTPSGTYLLSNSGSDNYKDRRVNQTRLVNILFYLLGVV